jgi:hypothetical protein
VSKEKLVIGEDQIHPMVFRKIVDDGWERVSTLRNKMGKVIQVVFKK